MKLDFFIVRSLNYGFIKGELSITQKRGLLFVSQKATSQDNF